MNQFQLGIDKLLSDHSLRKSLKRRRIALLVHAASVTSDLKHSAHALIDLNELNIVCLFSPQHGLYSEKQDNMLESPHGIHPFYHIPIYSLYSASRRPTEEMMNTFDVLIADIQDVGSRVYTYITTLFYLLQAATAFHKEVWVLDRPNPAGRQIEGCLLQPSWKSFIGVAPTVMRHGMTVGELTNWYVGDSSMDLALKVINMNNYQPERSPGFGWPLGELSWINPSPNIPNPLTTLIYPGTVLIEGTTLSEGRGTTRPFEVIGAPDLDFPKIVEQASTVAPRWFNQPFIRFCNFEPVFDKHAGRLCLGIQVHLDHPACSPESFKPIRWMAILLKAIRVVYPDYELWHDHPFEYEVDRRAIDLLWGSDFLRQWVDRPDARYDELEEKLAQDEQKWKKQSVPYIIYK